MQREAFKFCPVEHCYRIACAKVIDHYAGAEKLPALGTPMAIEVGTNWLAHHVAAEMNDFMGDDGTRTITAEGAACAMHIHLPQRVELLDGWRAVFAAELGTIYLCRCN